MSKSWLAQVVFSSNNHMVCYACQTCIHIQSISPVFSKQITTKGHKNESTNRNRFMYDHVGIDVTLVLGEQKFRVSNLYLRSISSRSHVFRSSPLAAGLYISVSQLITQKGTLGALSREQTIGFR